MSPAKQDRHGAGRWAVAGGLGKMDYGEEWEVAWAGSQGPLGRLDRSFPVSKMNWFRRFWRNLPAPAISDLEQFQPPNSSEVPMTWQFLSCRLLGWTFHCLQISGLCGLQKAPDLFVIYHLLLIIWAHKTAMRFSFCSQHFKASTFLVKTPRPIIIWTPIKSTWQSSRLNFQTWTFPKSLPRPHAKPLTPDKWLTACVLSSLFT